MFGAADGGFGVLQHEHGLQAAGHKDRDEAIQAREPFGSQPVGGELLAQGGQLGVNLGGDHATAQGAAPQAAGGALLCGGV